MSHPGRTQVWFHWGLPCGLGIGTFGEDLQMISLGDKDGMQLSVFL